MNAFLFPVHTMFRHDCPLAVKPASASPHVVHKKIWRDSLPIDMTRFVLNIPATLQQMSEIPEGLVNYPAYKIQIRCYKMKLKSFKCNDPSTHEGNNQRQTVPKYERFYCVTVSSY
jgi:hypothetical protein